MSSGFYLQVFEFAINCLQVFEFAINYLQVFEFAIYYLQVFEFAINYLQVFEFAIYYLQYFSGCTCTCMSYAFTNNFKHWITMTQWKWHNKVRRDSDELIVYSLPIVNANVPMLLFQTFFILVIMKRNQ